MVRDLFIGQASARIMNRIGLMVALVPALSPTLGSLLLAAGHWRWIFGLMFIYAVVLMGAMLFLLPETNSHADPAPVSYTHLDVYKRQLYRSHASRDGW